MVPSSDAFRAATLDGSPVEETISSWGIEFTADDVLGLLETPQEQNPTGWGVRRASGEHFRDARLVGMGTSHYPREMARLGQEGWVVVSFVITTDGTVRDVVVEDSSGDRSFESAAAAAVRRLVYEPALLNGEPVEQAVPLYKVRFMMDEGPTSASPEFASRASRINRHIRRGELEKAARLLERLEELPRHNRYEDAAYWWVKAAYEGALGNMRARRQSLLRAIGYGDNYLAPDLYLNGLQLLYADYVRTGELAAALETYNTLSAMLDTAEQPDELRNHVEGVRLAVAGRETLRARAYIEDARPWAHSLSREWLEIGEIDGRLDRFSVWCRHQARELEISGEAAWHIPPSWGPCRIFVYGEPGTAFSVWEYDDGPEEAGIVAPSG